MCVLPDLIVVVEVLPQEHPRPAAAAAATTAAVGRGGRGRVCRLDGAARAAGHRRRHRRSVRQSGRRSRPEMGQIISITCRDAISSELV